MSGYNTDITLKQLTHLGLSQPYGLIGKKDINFYDTILRFIYDNLVIHDCIKQIISDIDSGYAFVWNRQ